MNTNTLTDFRACIEDLISNRDVLAMENVEHHVDVNCLDHCIFVAYISYRICRFLGWDFVAAARGGLLHDLYLYDQQQKKNQMVTHLNTHPKVAHDNASKICELSDVEKDIILKHMWPITLKMPRYKESFVVNIADKICALAEVLFIYRWMKMGSKLCFAN